VVDSHKVSDTPEIYRDYIECSRGEFSVAKNVYVATRSGWFSCRSVCYLAAGRPVVVQDTGFSEIIPCGEGVLSFTSVDEAAESLRCVENDYERHQDAARQIAAKHFASEQVLGDMLHRIGLG
jgi:glycosyltransferase involved in cell wall biosynthesis